MKTGFLHRSLSLILLLFCVSLTNAATITLTNSGWWNRASTWPGGVRPTMDDDVVVPEGLTLTLLGTCRAKSITVMGKLTALDHQVGGTWVNLRTKYIMVMGPNASMEIGKSTSFYKSDGGCTITLVGDSPGEKIPGTDIDSKAIMVMNGATLNLFGAPKKPWVKIGAQTPVGFTSITLSEAIDWNEGDEIVITSNRVDAYEAETRIITSISGDNKTVFFSEPLLYPRIGELKNYSNGSRSWLVDTRAEVGLLSRNIKIQGDDYADTTGYGGHIMIMGGSVGNADNVELYKMGQKAVLARYPWHWHMLEAGGEGQFITNSAIHRSYNRAITIHGTWGTLVDNNVAYDHVGHGIFLEDGSEINNTLSNNLVLLTKNAASEEEALLDSDFGHKGLQGASPGAFWITNANNTFRNNVVAGTEGTAYWFVFPDHPTGLSAQVPSLSGLEPRNTDLKEFSGNVAHSCYNAIDMNDGLNTDHELIGNRSIRSPNPYVLTELTAFSTRLALYTGIGDRQEDIIFENCVFSDNEIHTMFASRSIVQNSIFIADSDNGLLDKRVLDEPSIFLCNLYDGAGRIYDSYLVNWNRDNVSLFKNNGAARKRINHLFKGITYNHEGVARIAMPSPQPRVDKANRCPQVWSNVVRDLDGSLTRLGVPSSIVNDIDFNKIDDLYKPDNWEGMHSVSNKYVFMFFKNQPVRVSRKDLTCGTVNSLTTAKCNLGPLMQLHLALDQGKYEHSIYCDDLVENELRFEVNCELNAGDALTVRFKGFGNLTNVRILNLTGKNSIEEVKNSSETAYYVEPSGDLYVKVITKDSFFGKAYRIQWGAGSLPEMSLETSTNAFTNVTARSLGACNETGSLLFSYPDHPDHEKIEFSIDGGVTFPYAVDDNTGNFVIKNLPLGNYSTYARWQGSSCTLSQGIFKLEPSAYGCKKWEFNTDNDFEKWNTNPQLDGVVQGGSFQYEILGNDPVFRSGDGVNAIASEYPFLRVRLQNESNGQIQLFWATTGGFGGGRLKTVDVQGSPDFQEVLIPLSGHPEWKDIINRLRVDFQFPQGETGNVDLISLEKEDLRDCMGVWEGTAQLDDCITSTAVLKSAKRITAYPNPSVSGVFDLSEDVEFKVHLTNGLEILSGSGKKVDLSTQPEGVYYLKTESEVIKLVK